jgi:hypothetical protein
VYELNALVIGVGALGIKLKNRYKECITITSKDLESKVINPSINEIRNLCYKHAIMNTIKDYEKIILLGDLSEKISRAIVPLLAFHAKEYHKKIYSIIAMPYSIESNILYDSKVAFDHINKNSSCVIIINKDALMINKELSIDKCNTIVDNSISIIMELIFNNMVESKENIIALTEYNNLRDRLINTLSILYNDCELDGVDNALIYISKNDLKLKDLEDLNNYMNDIFPNAKINTIINNSNNSLVMLSPTLKFSKYDPLIKLDRIDDMYMDNLIRIDLKLPQMEL